MKRFPNYPAFPVQAYPGDRDNSAVRSNSGMSILDYFAAAALTGLLASGWESQEASEESFKLAEKMLTEKENYK